MRIGFSLRPLYTQCFLPKHCLPCSLAVAWMYLLLIGGIEANHTSYAQVPVPQGVRARQATSEEVLSLKPPTEPQGVSVSRSSSSSEERIEWSPSVKKANVVSEPTPPTRPDAKALTLELFPSHKVPSLARRASPLGPNCSPRYSEALCVFEVTQGATTFMGVKVSPYDPVQVHPVVVAPNASGLKTLPQLGEHTEALALINGGYYDRSRGTSMSWIVQQGEVMANPSTHPVLGSDTFPWKKAVLNRSEWRAMSCTLQGSKTKPQIRHTIARHFDPLPSGCTLLHAVGGGPQLLPLLTQEEEAFWIVDPKTNKILRDAIGAKQPNARTGVGILPDGTLLLTIAMKDPHSGKGGVSLAGFASWFLAQGCVQALNLDGGSSTALWLSEEVAPTDYTPSSYQESSTIAPASSSVQALTYQPSAGARLFVGKPLADGSRSGVRLQSGLGVFPLEPSEFLP
ncbi:MAG: phosphodiester glycosidase family protein [Vampirovibrionales bacterium]